MNIERPNKKEYDFNDPFEVVRFALRLERYADYLEAKLKEEQPKPPQPPKDRIIHQGGFSKHKD